MTIKKFTPLVCIGNTPIVKFGNIYAKFEGVNPSGSIKDRAALEMVEAAESDGRLKKGYTIVEASSGNTGISLAMIAAVKGYHIIVVMPENMSEERMHLIKAFGAELVLTSKVGSLKEAVEKAEEIGRQPNTFYTHQFSNLDNTRAQEKTGEEIIRQIGPVDAVVAGVGTGGTLMGISNVVRKVNPSLVTIAVEPEEASVMSGGNNAPIHEHRIQGIGDGFIPQLIDMQKVDRVITVSSEEAIGMARKLARENGLLVGISSGANMLASLKVSREYGKIATVLPDRAERYISMGLFSG